jgi:hypothetical protein
MEDLDPLFTAWLTFDSLSASAAVFPSNAFSVPADTRTSGNQSHVHRVNGLRISIGRAADADFSARGESFYPGHRGAVDYLSSIL